MKNGFKIFLKFYAFRLSNLTLNVIYIAIAVELLDIKFYQRPKLHTKMKVELALVSLFVASILASTESLESDNLASASEAASQPSNTQPQASNWLPYWLRWDNIPYKSQAESVSKIEDTGMTAENTLAAAEASSLSWYSSWRSCTNLWYGSVASPLDEMPEGIPLQKFTFY